MEILKIVGIVIACIGLLVAIAIVWALTTGDKKDCWDGGEDLDECDERSRFVVNSKGVLEELGYHNEDGRFIEPEHCPLCLQSDNENRDAMYRNVDPSLLCRCKDCGRVYDVIPDMY